MKITQNFTFFHKNLEHFILYNIHAFNGVQI
jgi:hypothetical protein